MLKKTVALPLLQRCTAERVCSLQQLGVSLQPAARGRYCPQTLIFSIILFRDFIYLHIYCLNNLQTAIELNIVDNELRCGCKSVPRQIYLILQSMPPCGACSGVQLVSAECGPGMQTAALQRCTDMVTAGAGPCACTNASKSSIRRFVITEKAPTRAFSVITNLRFCFGWNFLKHYSSRHDPDLLYSSSSGRPRC